MISKTFVEKITELVRENEACRNSDVALTIELWKRYSPEKVAGGVVKLSDLYDLPREDAVKRIRAALCHEAELRLESGKEKPDDYIFFPTSEKVAKARQINQVIWQKALGYLRGKLPQSEQLPRPVGDIGFTLLKRDFSGATFEAQGADRKKYKVYQSGEVWTCECEAYRFSFKVKTCKHIKAIKDYIKKQAEAEAAKNQSNLF